jgi:hypothetical protein
MLASDIFMRVGKNSSANLISLNNSSVKVELQRGQVIVEIGGLPEDGSIHLLGRGLLTQLLKKGLYEFDADRGQFCVLKGEAVVQQRNQGLVVASEHQFALTPADQLSTSRFKRRNSSTRTYIASAECARKLRRKPMLATGSLTTGLAGTDLVGARFEEVNEISG